MDLGIEGKVALVTGGSHGIGRAIARALSREGVQVAICGRRNETLVSAAESIQNETGNFVLPVVADVLARDDIENFVSAALQRFGTIDIAVNNADLITHDVSFFDLNEEDWLEKVNIKLLAPIRMVQLVAPVMRKNRWGRIINIGGGSSRTVNDGSWAKGATQPGLINLTKRLSRLLGRDGITVNLVEPGNVWTDGRTRMGGRSRQEVRSEALAKRAEQEGISYAEMEEKALSELVIGRRIQPEDAANMVAYLSSQLASAITGETILVDGGEKLTVRY